MNNHGDISRITLNTVLIFLFFAGLCYSQTGPETSNQPNVTKMIDELTNMIDSLRVARDIPGAGLAIVTTDTILYAGGVGYANVAEKIPVTADTRFRMGSVTKNFVALGFLKLSDEGRIDLNTPVREIVPEIEIINPWAQTDPVRVVHLLEHTSGMGNSLKEFNVVDDPEIPLREGLEVVKSSLKIRFRPGTCHSYSNTGYGLAGFILEKIVGTPYEDHLAEAILTPLGMESSNFRVSDSTLMAQGYLAGSEPAPPVMFYSRSAGIMVSSARDMAKYVQFMLNYGAVGDEQILSREWIERMERPMTSLANRAGLNFGYGLGTETFFSRGYRWSGHNGAHLGFYSDFWYNRDLGLGYVILNNRFDLYSEEGLQELRTRIRRLLVPQIKTPSIPVVAVDVSQLERYAGVYVPKSATGEFLGWVELMMGDVTVTVENGALYADHFDGGKAPLVGVTDRLFRDTLHPQASVGFFNTPEGKSAMAGWNEYYEKTRPWKPWTMRIWFFFSWIAMLSTILYAAVWIPVHLYKKIAGSENRSKYIRMRVCPLLTILVLIYGIALMAGQEVTHLAEKSAVSVQFTISTWLFAALSFLSLFYAVQSFKKPVSRLASIYATVVSLSCAGMTVFLYYWNIIGIMLWA